PHGTPAARESSTAPGHPTEGKLMSRISAAADPAGPLAAAPPGGAAALFRAPEGRSRSAAVGTATAPGAAGAGPGEAPTGYAHGAPLSDEGAGEGDGGPWEELVTTALLGPDRRTPPGAVPGPGAPLHLLDAAAEATVRRRAGARPDRAAERPAPAPPDPRPALPPAAAHRLALLLSDRPGPSGGRRGTAPDLRELLPQWLAAANDRGFAAPAALLPALLDAARARTDLRPAALRFAGPRALWLARLNPDWRFALRATSDGGPSRPGTEDPAAVRRLWQEGLFAERVA